MVVFRKARSNTDREAVYRLRSRVVHEHGSASHALHVTGRDEDVFDEYSSHAVAWHFNRLPVGTLRLVHPNPFGFPVENVPGVKVMGREQAVEISKLAISRISVKLAGMTEHQVLAGLLGVLCRESMQTGIRWWYVMLSPGMCRLALRSGIRPLPVGVKPAGEQALYMMELRQVEGALFVSDPLSPLPRTPKVAAHARLRRSDVRMQ